MATLRSSPQDTAAPGALLERADHLAALEERLALALSDQRGSVAFIGGEAGVGKSALVRRFCETSAQSVRILTGMCDPLYTPRPLGPLFDIAPMSVSGSRRWSRAASAPSTWRWR